MSIHKICDGLYKVRWREGGRNRSTRVHGPLELGRKVERKKMSARDENRHLDDEYGSKRSRAIGREVSWRASGTSRAICSFAR